jgi:hypothetical protein
MEQNYSDGSITIQIDGDKLQQMDGLDLAVYHTPGSSRVYIANGPQFQNDRCVATVQQLLDTLGYDGVDGLDASDIAELTIKA